MIGFNDIPANLRLPGAYIEMDNSLANNASIQHKVLFIGQRLSTGSVAEAVPTRITSIDQGEEYFGRGSQLAGMLKAGKTADEFMETWAIALNDDVASSAAAGSLTVTGAATDAGALSFYIAGEKVAVGVANGNTQEQVAAAIVAAINANTELPVTAQTLLEAPNQVDLTARHAGLCGNDIDLRQNYYNEAGVAGVTVAISAMAGGAVNPDIDLAISVMGSEWYNWIVCPLTDAANLVALESELDSRWGPMRQMGCRAFIGYAGGHAAVTTFGSSRNSPHVVAMGTNDSPTLPSTWASVFAMTAAKSLSIDPARPLQTLKMPGLKAGNISTRWTDSERNLLLFDGISTYTVGRDGSIYIERAITTYQVNAQGIADDSYLNLNTPETLERIRYEQRAHFLSRYPRHKLAADDAKPAPGQPVMQPKLARGELLALYKDFEAKGWCQDYPGYKARLIVNIDPGNPDRMNWQDSPKLVSGLRTIAAQAQFRR